MNDDMLNVILLIGVLALVGRALLARRAPFRTILGSLLLWAAIGMALFVGFNNRDNIDRFFATLTGNEEQRAEGGTVRIQMARDGHFWARVKLNGYERRMLIDSGATITALSGETAAAAGVDTDGNRMPVTIETANGTVRAVSANLQKLAIGPLATEDLSVVVSPAFGEMDVIGMNFLSRLKSWRVEGNVLILEPDDGQAEDGASAGNSADAPR